ncbi:MAG: hypothetical protein ABSG78_07255 [Verrucomicrobiota bacterium]|jgi:hypothetical protein
MPDTAKAELLRALGRLVRGLSTLFWGLALTGLVGLQMVYLETAQAVWRETFSPPAFLPAFLLSPLLWHGLNQLRAFQPQERIWQRALSRAEIFTVLDAGLAPFLYWWHKFPSVPLYAACVGLLFLSSLFLLVQINCVLQRLCAMLPDETLRAETRLFTGFNISLLLAFFAGLSIYFLLTRLPVLPVWLGLWMEAAAAVGIWLALFLILMPLAMTMALLWKIKEVIFTSLTNTDR